MRPNNTRSSIERPDRCPLRSLRREGQRSKRQGVPVPDLRRAERRRVARSRARDVRSLRPGVAGATRRAVPVCLLCHGRPPRERGGPRRGGRRAVGGPIEILTWGEPETVLAHGLEVGRMVREGDDAARRCGGGPSPGAREIDEASSRNRRMRSACRGGRGPVQRVGVLVRRPAGGSRGAESSPPPRRPGAGATCGRIPIVRTPA